jgi:pseudouridine-5'-phosphate glycosidase
MTRIIPDWLEVEPEIRRALDWGGPVVALESTVLTHGLPRPINLELARRMEGEVRRAGALPATAAVLHGKLRLGLKPEELQALAMQEGTLKVSLRDLGAARVSGASGGTTVAATMYLAQAAGVQVFATGGIGGVHRGGTGDVSADLPALAEMQVAVVCAGAKAILDLPRTLEWLETAGIPVIGLGTDEFPAFYSRESGLAVSARAEDAAGAALLLRQHWDLGLPGGILVCVPCPADEAVEPQAIARALEQAEREAGEAGVRGPRLTPYLLARIVELTEGQALRANLALLQQNAHAAAEIAVALA